ncbi:hypothetical protein BKA62DRAFT_694125 [Auriculariales sp. MPI-PUGE-AT-0066]|nr:hypothetical protein BKA62DRAFT_694125 [Auriculariales sp. MPI-PUGE-AT-0066]
MSNPRSVPLDIFSSKVPRDPIHALACRITYSRLAEVFKLERQQVFSAHRYLAIDWNQCERNTSPKSSPLLRPASDGFVYIIIRFSHLEYPGIDALDKVYQEYESILPWLVHGDFGWWSWPRRGSNTRDNWKRLRISETEGNSNGRSASHSSSTVDVEVRATMDLLCQAFHMDDRQIRYLQPFIRAAYIRFERMSEWFDRARQGQLDYSLGTVGFLFILCVFYWLFPVLLSALQAFGV